MALGVVTTLILMTFLMAQPSNASDEPTDDSSTSAEVGPSTGVKVSVPSALGIQIQTLGQCPSGYFCVWSQTNYTGSIQRFNATGKYLDITIGNTRSAWNNRTKKTYYHEDDNGKESYSCYNPGVKSASLTGWKSGAEAVYLSTVTNC